MQGSRVHLESSEPPWPEWSEKTHLHRSRLCPPSRSSLPKPDHHPTPQKLGGKHHPSTLAFRLLAQKTEPWNHHHPVHRHHHHQDAQRHFRPQPHLFLPPHL